MKDRSEAHTLVLEAIDELGRYARREGIKTLIVVGLNDDDEMICQTAGSMSPVKALGMIEAAKSRWIHALISTYEDDDDIMATPGFGSVKNDKAS